MIEYADTDSGQDSEGLNGNARARALHCMGNMFL